jgi:glycosyltransferase involved in cell wall biosynthesis
LRPSKFRIAMIPGSTDGVNYYRLATWAFEMRKYRNTIVDLAWFRYETNPAVLHTWQDDLDSTDPSGDVPGLTIGQYIRASIDHFCEQADVVIWHPMYYERSLDLFLEMKHKHQKPFIIEVDDNYIDVPPWNEAYHSFRNGGSFRRISLDSMRNADALMVTTPHLGELYTQFNENVYVIENSLDFKGDRKFVGWDKVSVRKHKGIRLGWIGGRAHFDDLMMVAPVLRNILEKYKDVTLCLINSAIRHSCELLNKPYPFEGLKNVHYADRSVAINRYAQFAASFGFDIGIAPLVDCNFNRSKSNLRWLEYSALKIPTVATEISHFQQSIRPGHDGLLVRDNALNTWQEHLETLIENESYRDELGRNAYKRVKADFNVKRNAPKYLRLLKKLSITDIVLSEPEVTYATV